MEDLASGAPSSIPHEKMERRKGQHMISPLHPLGKAETRKKSVGLYVSVLSGVCKIRSVLCSNCSKLRNKVTEVEGQKV
jgi:hypothetical protein